MARIRRQNISHSPNQHRPAFAAQNHIIEETDLDIDEQIIPRRVQNRERSNMILEEQNAIDVVPDDDDDSEVA